MQAQHDSLEEQFLSLESWIREEITEKFTDKMVEMKVRVKEKVWKKKEKLEEHVNSNFAFLEDSIMSKIAAYK